MILLSALMLCLAIGFSWHRFCRIFSEATDHAVLLSPATALASAISVSATAMAIAGNPLLVASAIVGLGLLISTALASIALRPTTKMAAASVSLLAYTAMHGTL